MNQPFDLLEYLENNDAYMNETGVVFDTFSKGMVFVTSLFSEAADSPIIYVALGNELKVDFFILLFGVKSAKDLENITHEKLWALYEIGLMEVTCMVEDINRDKTIGVSIAGDLVFNKTPDGLVAQGRNTPKGHLVGRELKTFDDFVSYTSNYLLIQSLSPR